MTILHFLFKLPISTFSSFIPLSWWHSFLFQGENTSSQERTPTRFCHHMEQPACTPTHLVGFFYSSFGWTLSFLRPPLYEVPSLAICSLSSLLVSAPHPIMFIPSHQHSIRLQKFEQNFSLTPHSPLVTRLDCLYSFLLFLPILS